MTDIIENDKDKTLKEKLIGKVFLVNKRGYGFISCKEVPFTRIYFHWTNMIPQTINFKELKRGDEVEFDLVKKGDGTYKAIKIDVLEKLDTSK